jgi:hypothetical protein
MTSCVRHYCGAVLSKFCQVSVSGASSPYAVSCWTSLIHHCDGVPAVLSLYCTMLWRAVLHCSPVVRHAVQSNKERSAAAELLLLLLLLKWVRATPDCPFMSSKSSSQTRLIGHTPQTREKSQSQPQRGGNMLLEPAHHLLSAPRLASYITAIVRASPPPSRSCSNTAARRDVRGDRMAERGMTHSSCKGRQQAHG